jgi:opacity protein-like surface antigen
MKPSVSVVVGGVLCCVLLPNPAPGQEVEEPVAASAKEPRVELFLGGVMSLADVGYSQASTSTSYLETARFSADYSTDASPGFEGGLQVNLGRRFGIAAGVLATSRDTTTEYSLEVPHPLYYNQARKAEGTPSGLSYSETSFHLDVVVRGGGRRFGVGGFAGVSFLSVKADLLGTPQYSQSYPYDAITLTSIPQSEASDSPVGFNVGAHVDFRFTRNVGLRAHARYIAATAKLSTAQGEEVEIEAGGFHVSAGLRLAF